MFLCPGTSGCCANLVFMLHTHTAHMITLVQIVFEVFPKIHLDVLALNSLEPH